MDPMGYDTSQLTVITSLSKNTSFPLSVLIGSTSVPGEFALATLVAILELALRHCGSPGTFFGSEDVLYRGRAARSSCF